MLESLICILGFQPFEGSAWFLAASDVSLLTVWGNRLYNIFLVALGLGFVIFVHELGHFLAAKLFGVKCEKFYVGFDVPLKFGPIRLPSKLAHFQWGETEYGIGIIPLGGYVKMLGQDDDPRRLKEENERIQRVDRDPSTTESESERPKLDPRSYPAKPVFARMIIISAGVVMNLIFGVLMAAVAFKMGVPYNPAIIGSVTPGDPAWQNGIRAGDRIVQIGNYVDDELSFGEMQQKVAIRGIRNAAKPVAVGYQRDGNNNVIEMVGTTAHAAPDSRLRFLALGLRSTSTNQLSTKQPFPEYLRLQNLELGDLQPGDRVVAVNGNTLESLPGVESPLGFQIDELMHPKLNEPVTLTVERDSNGATSKADVTVPPLPLRTLGMRFAPDAVLAVAKDSPAARAGVQPGDRLLKLNGQPIDDAFGLPLFVAASAGKSLRLELQRGEAESVALEWTVPERFQFTDSMQMPAPSGFEIVGSGLVFSVSNTITKIDSGSAAEKSGLRVGDRVKQFQLKPTTDEQKKYFTELNIPKSLQVKLPVDGTYNMQYFLELAQLLPADLPIAVYVERDGKVESCETAIAIDPSLHLPDRGLSFMPLRRNYVADTWMQALSLGVSEIWKRLGDVLEFLELLVTGKAFKFIGGPGTIAVQAADAASQGIPPLLMFLTLLSANLALVNFLPIPALDGGHMVFLIFEAIRGKPVNEELQMKLTMGGILALLSLMIWAIFNDYINLSRYFGG